MADFGAYKNGEGYADPTAYEAVRGMAKPGEIWSYKDKEVLIVRNQGTYCNILQLGPFKKGSVDVAGRYANPGMLSYAFNDMLTECVWKVSNEEFEAICDEIAEALNLGKSHGERTQTFDDPVSYARHGTVTSKVDKEKEALRAKAELLQNMYNDLLGKVIAKLGV